MNLDSLDLATTLVAWGIVPNATRPAPGGDNNTTVFVDTGEIDYYLRIYPPTADADRVVYEHALLGELGALSLPFRRPQPLPATTGETFVTIAAPAGPPLLAALFAAIPGEPPRREDARQVQAAGEALAILDNALKGIEGLPEAGAQGSYGDLHLVHPLVPDPRAAIDSLPLDAKDRRRLTRLLDDVIDDTKDLYRDDDLPRQLIHGDFGIANTLVDSARVTGVIDFDYASPDLRVMDLACGVASFSFLPRQAGAHWPALSAFVRGYLSRMRLTEKEAEPLPKLLRLREVTVVINRIGRWQQGLATEPALLEGVDRLFKLNEWLDENDDELSKFVVSNLRL